MEEDQDLSHTVDQIPDFDFAEFLDRHYMNLGPGVRCLCVFEIIYAKFY